MVFDKSAKISQWRMASLFNKWCWINSISIFNFIHRHYVAIRATLASTHLFKLLFYWLDLCKNVINWLHWPELKDILTLWLHFYLTNCVFSTDFNVFWHIQILNLWGEMYVITVSLLLFLVMKLCCNSFSFPQGL